MTSFPAVVNLSSLNGNNGFRISGEAPNHNVGWVLSSAGVVNDDGFDDVISGDSSSGGFAGAAYVVFGKASGFPAILRLPMLTGAMDSRSGKFWLFRRSGLGRGRRQW
jgi:hypothetical protein